MREKIEQIVNKFTILALIMGVLMGLFGFIVLKATFYKSYSTHYHANFGLYINGKRDEFNNFSFYEEIQACSSDSSDPKTRAHMHNNENHIIHVHAKGVTWNNFFNNLDYDLSDKYINTQDGLFVDGKDDKKLTFILNGKEVKSIASKVIGNEDALLISYGNDDSTTLRSQYDTIPKDAHKENLQQDPASCGGSQKTTAKDRFIHAINLRGN